LGGEAALAQTLDDGGVGHPAALAHRLESVTTTALLQRINQCCHDARTAGAQRVADRDRAAIDVRLGQIRPGIGSPGQCRLGGAWIRRLNAAIPGCAANAH
jgi:hypothetical protein